MPFDGEAKKVTRDAFLYMDPKGDPEKFAQCESCRFFMPGKEKCAPMDGEHVLAGWSCGGYAFGTPSDDQPITKSWTPKEAGLVKRAVRCEHCRFFDEPETCGLYASLNKKAPETFDLNTKVSRHACCNAQEPIEKHADGGTIALQTGGSAGLDFSSLKPAEEQPAPPSLDFSQLKPLDFSSLKPLEQPPPPPSTGWVGTALAGLKAGTKELAMGEQAEAALKGHAKAPEPEAETIPEAQPVEWKDFASPGLLARKAEYQLAKSYPTAAAGIVGGAAGTALAGPVGGMVGGAAGAWLGSTVQSIGPQFAAAMKENPSDPDAAFDTAIKRSVASGAIGAVGWGLFGVQPFASTIKNMLFQAFGVQPAVSAAGRAAENIVEGKPAGEGVAAEIPGAIVGTALPLVGHAAISHLAGSPERPATATPAVDTLTEVPPAGEAPAATAAAPEFPPAEPTLVTPAPAPSPPEVPPVTATIPPPPVATVPPEAVESAKAEQVATATAKPMEPTPQPTIGPEDVAAQEARDKLTEISSTPAAPVPPPTPTQPVPPPVEAVAPPPPVVVPPPEIARPEAATAPPPPAAPEAPPSTPVVAPEPTAPIAAPAEEPTPPPRASNPRDPLEVGREIRDARYAEPGEGKVDFHGLDFTMDFPEGAADAEGNANPVDQGRITEGGNQVATSLGPNPESHHAFVIDQAHPETGAFDGHRVMLGYRNVDEAKNAFADLFSDGTGPDRVGNVTPMSLDEIKTWVREGDLKNPIGQSSFSLTEPEKLNPASAAAQPGEKTPPFQLADQVTEALEDARNRNKALSPKDIQAMAEKSFGGTLAEKKFTRDQLYDALELGVNQWVTRRPGGINPREALPAATDIVGQLEAMKKLLPTQTVRAGEKDRFQQFSTPPDYSYAAAWMANITPEDHVLEPSAGNGSLVAMAKNAYPREITTNELFLPRAANVESLGVTRGYHENAEQLHNILPPEVRPSVVLMNPPFSQTAGRMGDKKVLMTGARHIEEAMKRLEPGGRLVAIVGRGMGMDSSTFAPWWRRMSGSFEVRANMGVPGSIYSKYGTNFGTRLLVIDKNPPSGRPPVLGEASSLPDLMQRLDEVRNDRQPTTPTEQRAPSEPVAGEPGGPAVVAPSEPAPGPTLPVSGPTPEPRVPVEPVPPGAGPAVPGGVEPGGVGALRPESRPGEGNALVPEQPAGPELGGAEPNTAVAPGTGEVVGGGGPEPHGVVLRPEGGAGSVLPAGGESSGVEAGEPLPEAAKVDEVVADPAGSHGEVTEAVYEPYRPQRIQIEGSQAHPGALVQTAALASVMPPRVDYAPRLPNELISSGALSDAQLEAITYAGNAHSQILPAIAGETPFRRGFFLGDGTGTGKGRQVAGIILDNYMQGKKKALWISENKTLIEDAQRDWKGLGRDPKEIFNLGKVKAGNDLTADRGIAFTTYDTLKGGERLGKDEKTGKTLQGKRRIDQLANWLGPDFDGVIAFDECVPAGTLIATPNGSRPIESLEVGDCVLGFDHAENRVVPTSVKRTFTRATRAHLHVIGPVIMTGNHPVWTEDSGYVPAVWIDENDRIRYLSQDGKHTYMRKLREGIPGQIPAQQKSLLQQVMHCASHCRQDGFGKITHERRAPRGVRSSCPSSTEQNETDGAISGVIGGISVLRAEPVSHYGLREATYREPSQERAWREWEANASGTGIIARASQVGAGIPSGRQASPRRVPALLPDRYCESCPEDCYRSRRPQPQGRGTSAKRCAENRISRESWVGGSAVREFPHPQGSRTGCGRDRCSRSVEVFNVETGTANYFANGLLVHNSHNLANSVAQKGSRGTKEAAAKALAGIELQQKLPNARVVYVSATGATEVSNLAYAERLGLWGRGTAFPSKQSFIQNIGSGGIAAMELVARDMKAMGSYVSRNLSYDDVKYDRLEHQLTPEQRENYDELAGAWQTVLKNINAALGITGEPGGRTGEPQASPRARMAAMSAFWSGHQRFFNQIITAMQMPSVLRAIEGDLKEGQQAVLQLVNTNEASQKRAIERVKGGAEEAPEDLEDLDLTPRDQLMQMVEKSFPVAQWEKYIDENGNERWQVVKDSQGNIVENPEAVRMRDELLDKLGSIRVPHGPLEMLLNHFGTDRVAEVTGRKQRVVHKPDEKGVTRATLESRPGDSNAAETDAFQNAKKPILVFSQAGGTGRSYHADLTAPSSNAQRSHYLVQAGWRADKAIQGFGRTHRTNQASAPIFHLVTTDLQGQRRFISSIARRLSQLGALTKGERRAGEQGLFSARDNLESPEASAALRSFWGSMRRGEIGTIEPADFEAQTGLRLKDENGKPTDPPEISQFLNRLLSLKFDMQNKVFGEFEDRLNDAVDSAAAAGTLDVGTETLKGDRITKEADQPIYKDPQSGAETKYVRLKVENKNHPATFDQIAAGQRNLSGRKPLFYAISKRTGKVFAVAEASNTTDPNTGAVTENYRLAGPLDWQYAARRNIDGPLADRNWELVRDEAQARDLWDKQLATIPEYSAKTQHLITGSILPIWDRLSGTPKVYRLQTADGERMLGRVVDEDHIGQVLRSLGAETAGKTYEPAEVAQRVLDGDRATLANGWTIRRATVAGEPRLELTGPDYRDRPELENSGAFVERIGYQTRFFIPTGERAAEVLSAIMGNRRPVVEMQRGREEGLAANPRGWESTGPGENPYAGIKRASNTTEEAQGLRASPEYSPDLVGGHEAARDYVSSAGLLSGHEYFAIVGQDGQIIEAGTSGHPSAIKFSDGLLRRPWAPDTVPAAFHHNHPAARNPLSIPDIMSLAAHGIASVTAEGSDGHITSASLTPEGRALLEPLNPVERQEQIRQMAASAEATAAKVIDPLVKRGMLPRERANELLWEARNRLLAAGGLIDYVSTKDIPAWLKARLVKDVRGMDEGETSDRLYRSAGALRPKEAMAAISGTHAGIAAGRSTGEGGNRGSEASIVAAGAEAPKLGLSASGPPGGGPPTSPPGGGRWGTPEERGKDLESIQRTDRRSFLDRTREKLSAIRDQGVTGAVAHVLDNLAGLERQEKIAGGGKLLPAALSPTEAARLARNSHAVSRFVIERGQVRFDPTSGRVEQIEGAKPLQEILKPIADMGQSALDDFQLWASIKRGERLLGEGRERNITPEMVDKYRDLDQLYAQPDGSNPFQAAHAELQEYNHNLLNFGEATGLINPQSRTLFDHDDYVPFFRAIDPEGTKGVTPGRQGIAGQRSPIRELKGGEARFNNILDNTVMNTSAMISRGMKNRAMQLTYDMGTMTGAITPMSKAARVEFEAKLGDPAVRDFLTDLGLDPATMTAEQKEAAKGLFAAIKNPDQHPNVVSVMVDGKPQYGEVKDPLLLRSIAALGPSTVNGLTRVLAGPARLLRGAVVFDPAFALAHNLRMALHAYALTGTNPIASMTSAVRMARGLDPIALKLMSAGTVSGHYDIDMPRSVREQIEGKEFQNSLVQTAADWYRFVKKIGEGMTRAADLGPRAAVYEHILAKTGDEAEAMRQARDLLDFSTHGDGAIPMFLAQTIPFLNARWQGLARTGRGLIGEDRTAVLTRMGLMAGAAIALWEYNQENHKEQWDKLEDWDRQYAYHVWLGNGPDAVHVRIPKPFEVGALTGSLPEMLLDYFNGTEAGSTRALTKAFTAMVLNTFKFNPIPVAVKPAIETYFNTDSYTGRPIVNEADEAQNAAGLYSPLNSPSIVALTHAYNAVSPVKASPEVVQHLLRGYVAGWASYITAATDAIGESAGWLPQQAAWGGADTPVLNRFVREGPEAANRIQTDFYDLKKEVSIVGQGMKKASQMGDAEAVERLRQEHPEYSPQLDKAMQRAGMVLARQRKQLQATLMNQGASAEAKRRALDQFYITRDKEMEQLRPMVRRAEGLPTAP